MSERAGTPETDAAPARSFAEQPLSVTEARANRERDASLWSPRDALLAALRDLDAGRIEPDALIVVHRDRGPDAGPAGACRYYNAAPCASTAIGLLTIAQHYMLASGTE